MPATQLRRLWIGGAAFAALLIAAVGWLFVISPELSSASSLRTEASDSDWQNTMLQSKVNKLAQESKNVGALTSALSAAIAALPTSSGLSGFTRQLTSQATAYHVEIQSIAVGSVSVVTADGTATATDATSTTAAGQLYAVPVTVVSTGSLAHQVAFLHAIQAIGPRRALVSSVQVGASGSTSGSIDADDTATIQLTAFSAPQTPEQLAELKKLLNGDLGN